MAASGREHAAGARLREEAFDWLARIRGDPDVETQLAFQRWYDADPRHADVFESVLGTWQLAELSSKTSWDCATCLSGSSVRGCSLLSRNC